jgi:hypothetical protein
MMARIRTRRFVASFDSTHEALAAEAACHEMGVGGRIIPTPVSIRADCGLAWSMPPEEKDHFEDVSRGRFTYFGPFDLEL